MSLPCKKKETCEMFSPEKCNSAVCVDLSDACYQLPDYPEVEPSSTTACYVRMPTKLTAENGAKAALMGEFSVPFPIVCPACGGDAGEYCDECGNSGEVKLNVNVPWITIKKIYAKAVQVLGT